MTLDETEQVDALRGANLPDLLTAFIGGAWTPPGRGLVRDVEDPATEQIVARFEESSPDVVASAIEDAATVGRDWARRDPADRGRILLRIADSLRANADLLARLESVDSGKPLSQARADIAVSARYFEYYGGAADKFGGETIPQPHGTFAYTVREPYGVVAHITPWNAPLSQMTRGVAPCLAAGNSVVVKPSELTPLTTLRGRKL
ncbi:aldehyde dehydrogenase family protein [Aeromicrobium sp. UC242_57]|uniref:aldehyde dehydrogenase family protein n=1 Tax=Aeromicrobium sp. UC242_57 TaxID=3374624 RepID=UPI0037B316A9